ncbi:MAG: hypothetical protein ABA06_01830 [Parcubacteria bacterium C7867-001]|nr:MAG: hypothetical protein ABA06_01830 [Parcubacteria bacterium C7867-001]
MNKAWEEYRQTLTQELGDELAHEFADSLYRQSRGNPARATRFFYELGMQWAPLMQHWGSWIEQNANGTVALIMRDAKPLGVLPRAKHWKHLYLNRLVCGISDELSGDSTAQKHPLLERYLKQQGCAEEFTFVDSGCYGTIVLELHRIGVKFKPLFFFSKNPSIPGFLNELGVSLKDGELLNDSLECGFPHLHARPLTLAKRFGKVQAVLQNSDALSVRFGKAAMRGVQEARDARTVSPEQAAESLLRLSERARCGAFTGILGHTSPEWTKKSEFLESWPKELSWT